MTIPYRDIVSETARHGFFRLLFRWKGSIYKLVWKELIIFVLSFYALQIIYRFVFHNYPPLKLFFEDICIYCKNYIEIIPLSFILGFYVTLIVTRWWQQFVYIPWSDELGVFLSVGLEGNDASGKMLRRTILRYTLLAFVIVFRRTSVQVKKRFPTYSHVVESGLATVQEIAMIENVASDFCKYWIPFQWAHNLLMQARREERIPCDLLYYELNRALLRYRSSLGWILAYDWVCLPIVYTQVVTWVVYMYTLASLFGSQYITESQDNDSTDTRGNFVELYFPFFAFLQFIFYFGWLKVAESLINPLGDDDDDFEVNIILDRNFEYGILTVDSYYGVTPVLKKDIFWGKRTELKIPYTKAATQKSIFMGSQFLEQITNESAYIQDVLHPNLNETNKQQVGYPEPWSIETPSPMSLRQLLKRRVKRFTKSTSKSSLGSTLFRPVRLLSGLDLESSGSESTLMPHTPTPPIKLLSKKTPSCRKTILESESEIDSVDEIRVNIDSDSSITAGARLDVRIASPANSPTLNRQFSEDTFSGSSSISTKVDELVPALAETKDRLRNLSLPIESDVPQMVTDVDNNGSDLRIYPNCSSTPLPLVQRQLFPIANSKINGDIHVKYGKLKLSADCVSIVEASDAQAEQMKRPFEVLVADVQTTDVLGRGVRIELGETKGTRRQDRRPDSNPIYVDEPEQAKLLVVSSLDFTNDILEEAAESFDLNKSEPRATIFVPFHIVDADNVTEIQEPSAVALDVGEDHHSRQSPGQLKYTIGNIIDDNKGKVDKSSPPDQEKVDLVRVLEPTHPQPMDNHGTVRGENAANQSTKSKLDIGGKVGTSQTLEKDNVHSSKPRKTKLKRKTNSSPLVGERDRQRRGCTVVFDDIHIGERTYFIGDPEQYEILPQIPE